MFTSYNFYEQSGKLKESLVKALGISVLGSLSYLVLRRSAARLDSLAKLGEESRGIKHALDNLNEKLVQNGQLMKGIGEQQIGLEQKFQGLEKLVKVQTPLLLTEKVCLSLHLLF
jgi:hypothetical protein